MRSVGPKTDHLSWDDLRTALHLARGGSVRRAARALGVSHSTILRRLEALEDASGVRLFEKKPDGWELTPAGQDVFDTARDLEEMVNALERRVQGLDARLAGPVRLTLPDPFLPLLLPDIRAIVRAHRDIEVTLAVATGYADLAHREADVALRTAAEPPPDLVGRRLASAGVGIYGSARYLAGRATKDLESLDWVGWEAESQMAFNQWMRRHVPKAHVALRLSNAWAIRDAVDADVGVAILPCALGAAYETWRRVKLVKDASAPLWILTHKDLRTTTRVRVVRDALAEAVVKKRAVIEGR
jgi:DNA-binding transcriptional LysR family regulator